MDETAHGVFDGPRPDNRQLLFGGGHLLALWSLAFVQPLLNLLGSNPDFFIARGNPAGDILILAFGFMFGPPLVMLGAEWLARLAGARLYTVVHLVLLTIVTGTLAIQLLEAVISMRSALTILLAIALGATFAWSAMRFAFLRNLLDILIAAPLVILVIFVFFSNTSRVIFPSEERTSLGASVKSDTPVVMIVFDEIGTDTLLGPDGGIDALRWPNFARMADTSDWFKNYTTTSYFTPTAVPGLLSGNRPDEDALPTSADQPDNVFPLLADSYRLNVVEPITEMCPRALCPPDVDNDRQLNRLESLYFDIRYVVGRLVLPEGIAATLPDVGTNFADFDGASGPSGGRSDALTAKARAGYKSQDEYLKYVRGIPGGKSTFSMLHIKQPHQPWKYSVAGHVYNESPIDQLSHGTGPWIVGPNGVATTQQRHLVQAGYADTLLGEAIGRMKKVGIWDDALVVVTADHGISFEGGDVPQRRGGEASMGSTANPPLMIKYPGQTRPRVDRRHAMTLDVVPTISRELDVDGMYETDGLPLQGPLPERSIEISDVSGDEYEAKLPEMIRQRRLAVAAINRRFGDGPLYTLGPAPSLIGRKAPTEPGLPPSGASASLDEPEKWNPWDPEDEFIPMFITGRTEGLRSGVTLAVAVNGVIRGTTKSFGFQGATHFGTLVDPDSIQSGRNRIDVFLAGGAGRLIRIGGTGTGDQITSG